MKISDICEEASKSLDEVSVAVLQQGVDSLKGEGSVKESDEVSGALLAELEQRVRATMSEGGTIPRLVVENASSGNAIANALKFLKGINRQEGGVITVGTLLSGSDVNLHKAIEALGLQAYQTLNPAMLDEIREETEKQAESQFRGSDGQWDGRAASNYGEGKMYFFKKLKVACLELELKALLQRLEASTDGEEQRCLYGRACMLCWIWGEMYWTDAISGYKENRQKISSYRSHFSQVAQSKGVDTESVRDEVFHEDAKPVYVPE